MRRFFSIPGLRWRGRIKQFEREVYDHWADGIDRSVWAPWCDHWVRSFAGEIGEGSAILDVGCGTGRALRIMAARHPSLLAGMDLSPKAVAVAREKLSSLDVDLRVGDAEAASPRDAPPSSPATLSPRSAIHRDPHQRGASTAFHKLCDYIEVLSGATRRAPKGDVSPLGSLKPVYACLAAREKTRPNEFGRGTHPNSEIVSRLPKCGTG